MHDRDKIILSEIENLSERLMEDRLYQLVIDEVNDGFYDEVAKIRSLEEAEGNSEKAKAFYVRNRVRRILDLHVEFSLQSAIDSEEEKNNKIKEYEINKNKEEKEKRENMEQFRIRENKILGTSFISNIFVFNPITVVLFILFLAILFLGLKSPY